jgi:chromosome partitioning protein
MNRIKKGGFKVQGIGTLWSLFRKENVVHRSRVEGWGKGTDTYLDSLPRPFETIIPNATKIAEAAEFVGIGNAPKTFRNKYSLNFANLKTSRRNWCNGFSGSARRALATRSRHQSRRLA